MSRLIKGGLVIFLIFTSLALASCSLFTDTSPRGLQERWLAWVRDGALGKNIYECKARKVRTQPCAVFFSKGDNPLSGRVLSNGNIEEEYEYRPVSGRCRYFYEYERDTGQIVAFRFEESQPYACRVSGV